MGKKVDLLTTRQIKTEVTRGQQHILTRPSSILQQNTIKETTTETEETHEEQQTNEYLNEQNNDTDSDNTTNNHNNNIEDNNNNKERNDENLENESSGNSAAKTIQKAKDTTKKIKETAEQLKKMQKTVSILSNPLTLQIILGILAVGAGVIALVLLMSIVLEALGVNEQSVAFGNIYNGKCSEITVIFTNKKNDYAVTGTSTYPLEEYVAGVVYGELFSLATNEELAKTYAIAARTFGLKHVDDTCTIESSDRRQVFHELPEEDNNLSLAARKAAEETAGQVLISNGDLYPVQYDAFCTISKDDNYYTIKQKEQKIPIEWAEKQGMPSSWLQCTCAGNHGRGMSTFGAYYLASEYDYKYDQLISYYYGDDEVTISQTSFNGGIEGITSIAGLEIKDTTKAKPLQQPIEEFLNSNGSSLDNMNSFIHQSVNAQGSGTRAGVVTAAVSTINYLYDNFNVKLPYYWGGKVYSGAIPSSFGKYSPSAVSRGGNVDYYKSFDCSGFVSWSIRNGGYKFNEQSTSGFDSNYSKNSCLISDSSCIGQPGDLINSRSGHVELIIAVDQENGKYFVAHSSGPGVVMQARDMHKGNSSNPTKIIFMEEFYSNPLNINPSY